MSYLTTTQICINIHYAFKKNMYRPCIRLNLMKLLILNLPNSHFIWLDLILYAR